MIYPDELFYSRTHEWLRKSDDKTAYIGVTDYAQHALGDIVYVDFKVTDGELVRGEAYCELESVKAVESSYMPVSGNIIEININLENDYGLVNSSPYGDGWLIKIRLSDASQLSDLINNKQYQELVADLEE